MLKIGLPDDESEHEALALQHWRGDGTVRLLRADPRRRAMLLERLHDQDLSDLEDVEACEVVAGFYPRLHRPALPQLRPLTAYVDRWLDGLDELRRDMPVPPRMVEQALHLGRALVGDPASTGVIIHGDLHYENVLAADREPWLVIDPKPMSGDPHYEPGPLLQNRWEEMTAGPGSLRDAIRRRFHAVVDAAGLDESRARDWMVVRMVVDASWSRGGRPPGRARPVGGRAGLGDALRGDRESSTGLSPARGQMVPVPFTIRSVNLGRPQPWAWAEIGRSSIEKHGVPGPVEVATLGLAGDQVSDTRHHGGVDQAVYAFAREDLDWWAAELGTDAARRPVRREPHDQRLRRQRGRGRRALAGRQRTARGGLGPYALQRLQGLDGGVRPRQHRLGQAVRRRGASRSLPAGDRGGRGVLGRPGGGRAPARSRRHRVASCSAPS